MWTLKKMWSMMMISKMIMRMAKGKAIRRMRTMMMAMMCFTTAVNAQDDNVKKEKK